eukprot:5507676-Amphidinium_carterae.3
MDNISACDRLHKSNERQLACSCTAAILGRSFVGLGCQSRAPTLTCTVYMYAHSLRGVLHPLLQISRQSKIGEEMNPKQFGQQVHTGQDVSRI